MSTLAKNVSQVVLYENQVSDFVALLWMQTPLGSRTINPGLLHKILLQSVLNVLAMLFTDRQTNATKNIISFCQGANYY